ncbi:lipid II flippase MurJ [Roseateles sp. DB2]|uniref:lipid II flippase MurJ n=1 Tax=Roseateles sp. DB2 TaxID=3453717 RepID=UPI003EEEA838
MSVLQRGLLRSGLVLSLALMAGRLAGFARELLLASVFGLSTQADVAIVLLTLPDLLVNLLLAGGLGVALVPALRGADGVRHAQLFAQASLAVTAVFGALALAFVGWPALWLGLLAPGVSLDGLSSATRLWAAIAVALPLTALSGVSSAALNAQDRFFVAGCGTLVFNLCVIAALGLGLTRGYETATTLLILGLGIALGAMLRWLSQLAALRAQLGHSLAGLWRRSLLDRTLLRSFGAGLASASLLVLVPVLIRACASWLGAGQLAAFNYAIKLVELPLGILITTLATVAYPRLSEAYLQGNRAGFDGLLGDSLRRSLVLSLAVVLCGWQFGDALVALLLGHGRLGPQEQAHVLGLMRLALLGVPWVGVSGLLAAALNAQQQAGAVLRCTALALLALPLLCLPGLLLRSAQALMWALPLVQLLLVLLLTRALGVPWMGGVSRFASKISAPLLAVSLPCAVGLWADGWLISVLGDWPAMTQALLRIALAGSVFGVAIAAGLRALHWMPTASKEQNNETTA